MQTNYTGWSYNEFLAFLFVYAAEMNSPLTPEELQFIKSRTQIEDIEKIRNTVDSINDAEGIELIGTYRQKYLNTPEKKEKARTDLENLLKTPGKHSQLETAAVHILEKLI